MLSLVVLGVVVGSLLVFDEGAIALSEPFPELPADVPSSCNVGVVGGMGLFVVVIGVVVGSWLVLREGAVAPSEPFPELSADVPSVRDDVWAGPAPIPALVLLTLPPVTSPSLGDIKAVSAPFPALSLPVLPLCWFFLCCSSIWSALPLAMTGGQNHKPC